MRSSRVKRGWKRYLDTYSRWCWARTTGKKPSIIHAKGKFWVGLGGAKLRDCIGPFDTFDAAEAHIRISE